MTHNTDRIEKQIFIKAPRKRVWRALTDRNEFGQWFRVKLANGFSAGARTTGNITYEGYEHIQFTVAVEQMVPERLFSWRWVPNAIDPARDYSHEPTTLVVFELEEAPGGTLLKVTESGFDKVPVDRRAQAYRGNDEGWGIQVENIAKHVTSSP
jgi:uncharacterized protein YndB with AHSA1/START domain